jgi:prolyl 4-hydroxylase
MVETILNERPLVLTIDDFMDYSDCDAIINYTKDKLVKSQVLEGEERIDHLGRTSSEYWITEPFESDICHKDAIEKYFNYSKELFEESVVINYKEGQEYQPHWDYFPPDLKVKQRRATAICYLNDCPEGGETIFPDLDLKYKTRKGTLLYFQYDYDLETNKKTLHGGTHVIGNNEKWIMTVRW